jgi:Protein of unknown function (DUF2971)
MMQRLFKYTTASTAIAVLKTNTLRWRVPDSFNDPFEFKNPFAYGFTWDELTEVALRRFATILTQPEEPDLFPGNPVAENIPARRLECKGRNPAEVIELIRPRFKSLVERFKRDAESDLEEWLKMKRTYQVLCLSASHDHILMWSHYADSHTGVVLGFEPRIVVGRRALATAQPVLYSNDVPVAVTLEEYVGWLTGQGPKPGGRDSFGRSLFSKSTVWAYENEWRIVDKQQEVETVEFTDHPFSPEESVEVYLGCRIHTQVRHQIISQISSWPSKVRLFQMKAQALRFELEAESLQY